MKNWKILSSREIRQLHSLLREQFGFSGKLDYAFLKSAKDNIYIVSRDIAKIGLDQLRVDSIGLYFGELKNENLRLSIEGSQLVGPEASINVVEIGSDDAMNWMKGNDIGIGGEFRGIVIVRSKNDFLGSGVAKNEVLLNHVPKVRRLPANA